jgi:hypothetical protein
MSTTRPTKLLPDIVDQLREANHDVGNAMLAHYLVQPREGTAGQLDTSKARAWCNQMDGYLVCFSTIHTKLR